MSTSIGKLQVDFVANLDKFIAGTNAAMKKMDEFAKKVGDSLKKLETGLKEIGEKMTKFVTLPLLGLAAAAIKAADPTGEFAKELKTLGVEALLALEPLGDVLIEMVRQAEPYLRKAIGFVRALMEAFRELEPSTQRLVVAITAGVAAIGPLAILGAGLVGVAAALAPAFGAVFKVLGGIVSLTVPIVSVAAAVGGLAAAAYLAFNAGRTLYENSQALQLTLENLRDAVATLAAAVRRDVKLMVFDIMASLSKLDPLIGFLKGMGATGTLLGTSLEAIKNAGDPAIAAAQAWAEWSEQVANLEQVHKTTIASINRDFAEHAQRKGFGELMADDFALVQQAISGLKPDLDSLMARAEAWARVSPEMAKAWEELAKKMKDAAKDAKLEDTFGTRVQRRIENFASSVGDSFADLALEGENSFKQLAKSFERMLVSMFATQLLFQPLFDAIGSKAGKVIRSTNWGGGGTGTSGGGTQTVVQDMQLRGGTGTTINVIDQRQSGAPVEVNERAGADGRTIDVIIRDSVKKLIRNGDLDKDMRLAYGANRSGRL